MDENMMNNVPAEEIAPAVDSAAVTAEQPVVEAPAFEAAPEMAMDPNMGAMPAEEAKPPKKPFNFNIIKKPLPFVMSGLMLAAITMMSIFFLVGIGQFEYEAISVSTFIPFITDFFDVIDVIDILLEEMMFAELFVFLGRFVMSIVYVIVLIRLVLRLIACVRASITAFAPNTEAHARRNAIQAITVSFASIFSMISSFALFTLMFPQTGEIALQTVVLIVGAIVFVLAGVMRRLSGEKLPKLMYIVMETVRDIAIMAALIFLYHIVKYEVFGNFFAELGDTLNKLFNLSGDPDGELVRFIYDNIFATLLRMIPAFTFMGVFYAVASNSRYAQKNQPTRKTVGRVRRVMITAIILAILDIAMPLIAGEDFDFETIVLTDKFLELWLPMILVSIAAMLIFRMKSPDSGIVEAPIAHTAPAYQPAPAYGYQPAPQYQQPMGGYQQPAAPQYQQPMGGYQQPTAPQYQQPMGGYQQPAAPQYQQPMGGYQQPAAPQYQQPMGGQYQQPMQNEYYQQPAQGDPNNYNNQ